MVDKTDDKTLTAAGEDDEELVMIEVDTIPVPGAAPAAAAESPAEGGTDDDDEDDIPAAEDRRLADDDDEDDDTPAKKERKKRRERQKAARDAAQARLRQLEAQNATLAQRLEALEGGQVNTQKALADRAVEEARAEVARAERIMAAAVEAGNGEDAVEAQRLRDEARDRAKTLEEFSKTLKTPTTATPAANPQAASYKAAWLDANPWFKPDGSDEDSAITIAIDNRVRAEGYDPGSVEYWNELTKRVARRLAGGATPPRQQQDDSATAPASKDTRRKGPPMGDSRNHAPPSTRREVYVTPERKKAMQDAGYWEDPVKRTQMLKAYAAHDRDNPVR